MLENYLLNHIYQHLFPLAEMAAKDSSHTQWLRKQYC